MTPYKKHHKLEHSISRHSPNGVDIIEECKECSYKALLQPNHMPITMHPYKIGQHELDMGYNPKRIKSWNRQN